MIGKYSRVIQQAIKAVGKQGVAANKICCGVNGVVCCKTGGEEHSIHFCLSCLQKESCMAQLVTITACYPLIPIFGEQESFLITALRPGAYFHRRDAIAGLSM